MTLLETGIYSIRCTINNHIYIGSTTKSFKQRWFEHKRKLNANKHPNKHLQSAWNKYGEGAFSFQIVEVLHKIDEIVKAEQFYLDIFIGEMCYNMQTIVYDMTQFATNMKGRKWGDKKRESAININAKQYSGFIDPNGNKLEPIHNLSQFIRDNNLNRRTIYRLMRGDINEYKGWTYVAN